MPGRARSPSSGISSLDTDCGSSRAASRGVAAYYGCGSRKSRLRGDDNDEPGRDSWRMLTKIQIAGALAVVAGFAGLATESAASSAPVGQPPPEWAANAGAWPAHNHDLANTRATVQTPINSQTVSQLKVKWRFRFKGATAFGIFASAPISLNGTVYLQDLNSNVYALDRTAGTLKWRHNFNKPSIGPNGVAFGNGRLYGATETEAFALDPRRGRTLWSRKLTRNK